MFKKRGTKDASTFRKRAADGGEEDDGGFGYAREVQAEEGDEGTVVKAAVVSGSTKSHVLSSSTSALKSGSLTSVTTVFESGRDAVPVAYSGDATHTSEIDTATDRDARAILERQIKLSSEDGGGAGGEYRGQAGYKSFVKKDLAAVGSNKHSGTQGPIRAPSFVRSSARFDYQPDICKDYKETGFCGYGDMCKFLHDRGDYKSGWQMEREWDEQQSKKKKKLEEGLQGFGGEGRDEEGGEGGKEDGEGEEEVNYAIESEEELPFACFLCRESFTNPIVTSCGHYFCSACIIEASKTNTKCPVCDKQTFGVFNKAKKLLKKAEEVGAAESFVKTSHITLAKKGKWEEV